MELHVSITDAVKKEIKPSLYLLNLSGVNSERCPICLSSRLAQGPTFQVCSGGESLAPCV